VTAIKVARADGSVHTVDGDRWMISDHTLTVARRADEQNALPQPVASYPPGSWQGVWLDESVRP
jgi:hypothetical protein